MSRSVHLNDRKAAYHVPHRQATDICHLQSFIFPLPASAPITNNHTHKHPQRSPTQSPHFQSISATYLSHHSNRLQHSSFLHGAGEWKERDGQKGNEKTEGTIHSFGRAHMFWKVLLWQQKLSSDTCPIDTLKWLPTQQKWWDNSPRLQIGRWECDVKEEGAVEVLLPAENSRYHLQPLSGLFYRFLSTSPSSSSMSPTLSAPPPSPLSLFTQVPLIITIIIFFIIFIAHQCS